MGHIFWKKIGLPVVFWSSWRLLRCGRRVARMEGGDISPSSEQTFVPTSLATLCSSFPVGRVNLVWFFLESWIFLNKNKAWNVGWRSMGWFCSPILLCCQNFIRAKTSRSKRNTKSGYVWKNLLCYRHDIFLKTWRKKEIWNVIQRVSRL